MSCDALRPAWLAARYQLPLVQARALIRERVNHHARRLGGIACVITALLLVQILAACQLVALWRPVHLLLWPACLLLTGVYLYLAQRAAVPEILQRAAGHTQGG